MLSKTGQTERQILEITCRTLNKTKTKIGAHRQNGWGVAEVWGWRWEKWVKGSKGKKKTSPNIASFFFFN